MGPGGYARPADYGLPEKFSVDIIVGILLIVASIAVAFTMVSAFGIGGSSGQASTETPGIPVMVVAGLSIAGCLGNIIGGIWMISSQKRGLTLAAQVGFCLLALGIAMGFVGSHMNPFAIGLGVIFPIYSLVRLYANVGPKAV
jgi:hypothetical protein